MLNQKKFDTKVAEFMNDSIIQVDVSLGSQTITANGNITREGVDISSSIPNGYKAVAAVLRTIGNNAWNFYTLNYNGNGTVTYQIRSYVNSSTTATPSINVICVKTP